MEFLTRPLLLILAFILLSSDSCRKQPLDKNGLPPATQEGKNTLGFLLNGEPWTPKGFNGTANLSMEFDPSYSGGVLGIAAYRIINNEKREYFNFGVDSVNLGVISKGHKKLRFYFLSTTIMCEYDTRDSTVDWNGELIITKLDTTNEKVIISGKFNVTLYKPGCDTIHITKGRFDMSLH